MNKGEILNRNIQFNRLFKNKNDGKTVVFYTFGV